jgi:hypothetical protein
MRILLKRIVKKEVQDCGKARSMVEGCREHRSENWASIKG